MNKLNNVYLDEVDNDLKVRGSVDCDSLLINGVVFNTANQGAKGDKGDKGDPGPIGLTGPPGPIGPTGLTGKGFKIFATIPDDDVNVNANLLALSKTDDNIGEFVLQVGGKLYIYVKTGGTLANNQFNYVSDITDESKLQPIPGPQGPPGEISNQIADSYIILDSDNPSNVNDQFIFFKYAQNNGNKYDAIKRDDTSIISFRKNIQIVNDSFTDGDLCEIQTSRINNIGIRTPDTDDEQFIITGKSWLPTGSNFVDDFLQIPNFLLLLESFKFQSMMSKKIKESIIAHSVIYGSQIGIDIQVLAQKFPSISSTIINNLTSLVDPRVEVYAKYTKTQTLQIDDTALLIPSKILALGDGIRGGLEKAGKVINNPNVLNPMSIVFTDPESYLITRGTDETPGKPWFPFIGLDNSVKIKDKLDIVDRLVFPLANFFNNFGNNFWRRRGILYLDDEGRIRTTNWPDNDIFQLFNNRLNDLEKGNGPWEAFAAVLGLGGAAVSVSAAFASFFGGQAVQKVYDVPSKISEAKDIADVAKSASDIANSKAAQALETAVNIASTANNALQAANQAATLSNRIRNAFNVESSQPRYSQVPTDEPPQYPDNFKFYNEHPATIKTESNNLPSSAGDIRLQAQTLKHTPITTTIPNEPNSGDQTQSTSTITTYEESKPAFIDIEGGRFKNGSLHGEIHFYTNDIKRMTIKRDGKIKVGNIEDLETRLNTMQNVDLSSYYTKTEIDNKGYLTAIPSQYIDQTELNTALQAYYTQSQIDAREFLTISALSSYYTKSAVDGLIGSIPIFDATAYYTKTQIDGQGFLTNSALLSYYTKSAVDTLITTIPIFDATAYYTKTQIDGKGYLTNIPSQYVDDSKLATSLSSYYTKVQADNQYLNKTGNALTQVVNLNFSSTGFNSGINIYYNNDLNLGCRLFTTGLDGASYSSFNGGLASWYGLGFTCSFDGITRHVFDTRTGNVQFVGNLKLDSLSTNRVLISDENKNVIASNTSSTILGYLANVSSDIQTQLDSKANNNNVVLLNTDQSIFGLKTFLSANTNILGGLNYFPIRFDNNGTNFGDFFHVQPYYQKSGAPIYLPTVLNYTGGNVGVGNNNPNAKLDVLGSCKITGPFSLIGNASLGDFTNACEFNHYGSSFKVARAGNAYYTDVFQSGSNVGIDFHSYFGSRINQYDARIIVSGGVAQNGQASMSLISGSCNITTNNGNCTLSPSNGDVRANSNIQLFSPSFSYAGDNSIKFIQNTGYTEFDIFPSLDTTSSVGVLNFRAFPNGGNRGNYPSVLKLWDSLSDRRVGINLPNDYDPQYTLHISGTFKSSDAMQTDARCSAQFFRTFGQQTTGGIHFDGDIPDATWQTSLIGGYALGFRRFISQYGWYETLAYINANGNFITISDQNKKENIQDIDSSKSLQKILNTHVVAYNLTCDNEEMKQRKTIGVLAQEMQQTNKHCVHENKDGELGVSYNDIFLHNINATKQIYQMVEKLTTDVEILKVNKKEDASTSSPQEVNPLESSNTSSLLQRIELLEQQVAEQQKQINALKKELKKISK